jgi:PAS domain S-box-containing protein
VLIILYCYNIQWFVYPIFITFAGLVYFLNFYHSKKNLEEDTNYRMAFNNTTDAFWVFDRNIKKIVTINRTNDNSKININKYLNKNLQEILPSSSLTLVDDILNEIDKENLPNKIFEIQIYRNKTELIWIKVSINAHNNKGKITNLIYGISKNIDAEKKIVLWMQKESARYKMICEGTRDTIWTIDINTGLFTYVSKASIRNSGYTPEDFIGKKTLYDTIAPPYRKEFFSKIYNTIEEYNNNIFHSPYITLECQIRHKDKYTIWCELSAAIVFNEQGTPTEILGTTSRIDERVEASQKILAQQKELEKLNLSKDKFFSIISHDLRNSLTALISIAELFDNFYLVMKSDEIHKYINILLNAANHLCKLLENLLEWTRSSTGQMVFTPKVWHLVEISTDAIDTVSAQALSKNIVINITYDNNFDYDVLCDLNMIVTVIRNLLSNAIKFSPFNTNIYVDICEFEKDKNFYKISIIDNGVGIEEDKISQLFDIGEKISTKGTNHEIGTGLGFILVKEFIDKHKCEIWVESEVEKGTTFSFTLPKATKTK